MNAPIHNDLSQDEMAAAVELECNVFAFMHDNHDAQSDRSDMDHLATIRKYRQKKYDIREKHRRARHAILDQITALQRKLEEVDAGAATDEAAADREIAKCRAFLAAGA